MSSPGRLPRGFTLIELLVAMAILTVLMSVVYSGLSVALTMWGSAGRRAEAFEETQSSLDILRNQIRGALPLLYVPETVQIAAVPRLGFSGSSDTIRFVSSMSWRDGAQGVPRWVELKSETGRLTVDERAVLPPSNTGAATPLWHSEVAALTDVRFRYLRRAQPGRDVEWRDTWDAVELRELPRAVGLLYTLNGRMESLTIPLDYADASSKGYQVQ